MAIRIWVWEMPEPPESSAALPVTLTVEEETAALGPGHAAGALLGLLRLADRALGPPQPTLRQPATWPDEAGTWADIGRATEPGWTPARDLEQGVPGDRGIPAAGAGARAHRPGISPEPGPMRQVRLVNSQRPTTGRDQE